MVEQKDLTVLFVGCGGTFWTSSSYFCALLKQLNPRRVEFIDPDILTLLNTERQWCQQDTFLQAIPKVTLAFETITPPSIVERSHSQGMPFAQWAGAEIVLPEDPVLVIVNVDNDEARLQIREWCLRRTGTSLMVMSGCDKMYGQVYYGVYHGEGALHDWKPFHLEVGDHNITPITGGGGGCGAQSTMSNYLTGALFAPAIDEALPFLDWEEGEDIHISTVGEWYWKMERDQNNGTVKTKMWTQRVARLPVEAVGEVL